MFGYEKENLIEITISMQELHNVIANEENKERRIEFLMDCQQAAIAVGEKLDDDKEMFPTIYGNNSKIVDKLEVYCEEVFLLSQNEGKTGEKVQKLKDSIVTVQKEIRELPLRYRIAFLPYKSDMWDSLESIYLAAEADERCEVIVCPIPYYENDRIRQEEVYRYEGHLLPATIPITYYEKLPLKDAHIDVAYIHNPYDNYNLVTSVHPNYYSTEIKKYVGKLIYVPYFMDGAVFNMGIKDLPVFQNADFIVLASNYMKKSCKGLNFYKKILPFGSPKFDAVIRREQEGVSIPEEWKELLEGKHVLMLNSTINEILTENDRVLQKWELLFDEVSRMKQIALLWRPHPLLDATLRAMRPQLVEKYEALLEQFVESKVGILDRSSDVTRAVVLAEGYIGSPFSSMIRLFEVSGKPCYLFSAYITEKRPEGDPLSLKTPEECGYGRIDKDGYYSIHETETFPQEAFLKRFAQDGFLPFKDHQIAEASKVAANLDGTCGQKVHEYVMKTLTGG